MFARGILKNLQECQPTMYRELMKKGELEAYLERKEAQADQLFLQTEEAHRKAYPEPKGATFQERLQRNNWIDMMTKRQVLEQILLPDEEEMTDS